MIIRRYHNTIRLNTSYNLILDVPAGTYGIAFSKNIDKPATIAVNGVRLTTIDNVGESATNLKPVESYIYKAIGLDPNSDKNKLLVFGFSLNDAVYSPNKPFTLEMEGTLASAQDVDIFLVRVEPFIPVDYLTLPAKKTATGTNGSMSLKFKGFRNYEIKAFQGTTEKNLQFSVLRAGKEGYILQKMTTPHTYYDPNFHRDIGFETVSFEFLNVPADHTIKVKRLEVFPIR